MNQYPGGYQPQQPRQGKNLFLIGAFSLIIVAALTVMTVVLINRNKDRSAENNSSTQQQDASVENSGFGVQDPDQQEGGSQEGDSQQADGNVSDSEPAPAESSEPAIDESSEEGSGEADVQGIAATVQVLERPSILKDYSDSPYTGPTPAVHQTAVASGLSNVYNLDQFHLNEEQIALLEKNGFLYQWQYDHEFFSVYEGNRYALVPNFVTVDSMMHTYHLYFAYLMKNTERNYLSSQLKDLGAAMAAKSAEQLEVLRGTEWENAALINLAFFTVGNVLLDPSAEIPSEVSDVVNTELGLIEEAGGIATSPLLKMEEDYSQYIPRGYYDTDEGLTRYFKAMMWYGRRNFMQKEEDQDRAALLMTLALDQDTLPIWESIYTITSFFAGTSDDSGYYEYKPLIDAAYGENITAADLPGNAAWDVFHQLTAQLDPPKINSVPVYMKDTDEERDAKILGFRFMGQRFTLDEAVFAQLIYRSTQENSNGEVRLLPDALDVTAAFGSDTALDILEAQGDTDYANYSEHMDLLRETIANAEESTWDVSLYAGWLNTLRPLLEPKGEGYPTFMQSEAWNKKNLTTFLGSYTELKHDTILCSKQVMAEMGGGGEIPEWDDRGYVEPEAEVYARLASLVRATSNGLSHYGMLSEEDQSNLALLADLADQLTTISEKELRNELLSDGEYDLIRTYGGQLEHFWQEVMKHEADSEFFTTKEFPAAIVADIATDPNGYCLEVGTGNPATILVIVEVDGLLKIAEGTCYTFYEFAWPMNDRLTDTKWREMMGIELNESGEYNTENAIDLPSWIKEYWYNYPH